MFLPVTNSKIVESDVRSCDRIGNHMIAKC